MSGRPYSPIEGQIIREACRTAKLGDACSFPHCRCIKMPSIVLQALRTAERLGLLRTTTPEPKP